VRYDLLSIDDRTVHAQAIFLSTKAHPNKQNQSQSQDTILRVSTMKAIKSIIIALLFTSTLSGCVSTPGHYRLAPNVRPTLMNANINVQPLVNTAVSVGKVVLPYAISAGHAYVNTPYFLLR
jgi:hypothetical protein